MKKLLAATLVVVLAAAVALGLLVYGIAHYAHSPMNPEADEPIFIIVEPGQSFAAVSRTLQENGLVDHPLKFKIVARYQGVAASIKAGEYRLSGNMTPLEMLARLSEGDVYLHRVTLPEGFNLYQVAERMAATGLCKEPSFLAAATNPDFANRLGIPAKTVEGYLFPETYFFERSADAGFMISSMVRRFHTVFSDRWRSRAREMGFSVHEIVTLAAIVEKETGVDAERPLIASVFHNRLKKGMRLESDPTVIYGIKNFDGNLTRRDLRTPTPYNTYTNFGLPPGPIANPGGAALEAALYPADTPYLYFVAKPDKTHHFSKTLAEHNRAVRKYQLSR